MRYKYYIDFKDGNLYTEVELVDMRLRHEVTRPNEHINGIVQEVKLAGSAILFTTTAMVDLLRAQFSVPFRITELVSGSYVEVWEGEVLTHGAVDADQGTFKMENFVSNDETNVYHRMLDILETEIKLRVLLPDTQVRLVRDGGVFPRYGGIHMVGDTSGSPVGIDGMLNYLRNQVFLRRSQFPIPDDEWFMMNANALIIDEFNDQEANNTSLFGLDETITFKDLLKWIEDTWNLYWYQDFSELRFAHPWDSAFTGATLDRVAATEHLERTTYITTDVVSKEITTFNNELNVSWFAGCEEFIGYPIEYPLNTDVVEQKDMSKDITTNVWPVGTGREGAVMHTDFTRNYDGFVFLHAEAVDGESYYDVVVGDGQLGNTNMPNAHFAKTNLHHNYFRDYSYYPKHMKVNNIDVVGELEKPLRILPDYKEVMDIVPKELGTIKWSGGILARVFSMVTDLSSGVTTYKSHIFKTDQAW